MENNKEQNNKEEFIEEVNENYYYYRNTKSAPANVKPDAQPTSVGAIKIHKINKD